MTTCERCGPPCLAEFRRLSRLPAGSAERNGVRDALVERHLSLARRLAAGLRGRGVPLEDLEQVAALGLVQAVDRFRPARGVPFAAFATPTITGCLKRHFRDNCWALRVPRGLKDLLVELEASAPAIGQELGRPPTAEELARRLGRDPGQVRAAVRARDALRPVSLTAPGPGGAGSACLQDVLGSCDRELDLVEVRVWLLPALRELPPGHRQILKLRFYDDLTQAEIASVIGCSQVQVSRILTGVLRRLRARLTPAPQGRRARSGAVVPVPGPDLAAAS